jgi:NADH-quinone oxidoreductase subunit A
MHRIDLNATLSPWEPGILALSAFVLAVLLLVALLLGLCSWLGVRRPGREKLRAYESGIIPTGSARLRYPVPFYLVAIFFLLFDLEGVFIFAWAIACRELGWLGWLQMSFFILVLLFGLIYIWKRGGLAWGRASQQPCRTE